MKMVEIEYEGDKDKVYSTGGRSETFAAVLARRLSRRGLLKGEVAASAIVVTDPLVLAQEPASTLTFQAIETDNGDEMIVAPGYKERIRVRMLRI